MQMSGDEAKLKKQIGIRIGWFMTGLIVSGLTAFPIDWQLTQAHYLISRFALDNQLTRWLDLAYQGVHETSEAYPFISYGTDWLGFAHLIIAVAFVGPWKDPVGNCWILEFGMIACLAILPFAFIAGEARGIPLFWRLIDCSFGVIGGTILWSAYIRTKALQRIIAFKNI
jgi:hypothetical protein